MSSRRIERHIARIVAAAVVVAAVAAYPSTARAEGDAAFDDPTTLARQLDDQVLALGTSDCGVACKALASMRRTADRLCELSPGPRCDAARAKVEDASRRVREACPECALAQLPTPPLERASAAPTGEAAAAPRRGGCAGCTTGPARTPTFPGALAVGVLAAFAFALRRRRKARRD